MSPVLHVHVEIEWDALQMSYSRNLTCFRFQGLPNISEVDVLFIRQVLEVGVNMYPLSTRTIDAVAATVLKVAISRIRQDGQNCTNISCQ